MKKLAFTLFVVLVVALTVWATEIQTFQGTASHNSPLRAEFTTFRDGDVIARVQWTPKNGVNYVLLLKRLADPNDTFSYTHLCDIHTTQTHTPPPPPGDWTCVIPNGPAGFYTAEFRPTNGASVKNVLMTVTAETDE